MRDFISIITVNYNGKRFLKYFLDSAYRLDYLKKKYEVIVVDNASTDDSVSYIKKNYPQTKVIESDKNLGFGGGNNLGIKASKGDFVFLVNNDTYIEKDALRKFQKCVKKDIDGKIAAYNAKMVLFDFYLPLKVRGGRITSYKLSPKKAIPVNNRHFNLSNDAIKRYDYNCYVPVNFKYQSDVFLTTKLLSTGKDNYRLYMGSKKLLEKSFNNNQADECKISIGKDELLGNRVNLIQNAGNIIFRNASGRDRGVIVSNGKQYYEEESAKYNNPVFLEGFCGAGVFIKRSALDEVGYFDEDFFMYYEDLDLSLRLKSKGYEIKYCPEILIRHIHSASSQEWSEFFIYHSERSRLLFLFKHWPFMSVLRWFLLYLIKDTAFVPLYEVLNGKYKEGIRKLKIRIKVLSSIIVPGILSIYNRDRLSRKDILTYH